MTKPAPVISVRDEPHEYWTFTPTGFVHLTRTEEDGLRTRCGRRTDEEGWRFDGQTDTGEAATCTGCRRWARVERELAPPPRPGRPRHGSPEWALWVAAIDLAISAGGRVSSATHNALVPWSKVEAVRAALDGLQVDWRAVGTVFRARERLGRRDQG